MNSKFKINLKEIIVLLNNKLHHKLKIHHEYGEDDGIDATFDVLCDNCGINFNLDLFKNKIHENMYQYNDIFYTFEIIKDEMSFNMLDCTNISCEEFIIKGIIE